MYALLLISLLHTLGGHDAAEASTTNCTPGAWQYVTTSASMSGYSGSCSLSFSRQCGSAGWWLSWYGQYCSYPTSTYRGELYCTGTVSCSGSSPSSVSCSDSGGWMCS